MKCFLKSRYTPLDAFLFIIWINLIENFGPWHGLWAIPFAFISAALELRFPDTSDADMAQHAERRDVLAQIELHFWGCAAAWRTGDIEPMEAELMQRLLVQMHTRIRTGQHNGRAAIMERLCHG